MTARRPSCTRCARRWWNCDFSGGQAGDGRATASTSRELKAGPPPAAIRILIAESDRALGDLYRAELADTGWDVEVVADARSVMTRFQQAPPTVLLVNRLPDADQATVVEQVRSMPSARDVVVVVLFDSMDHVDVQRLRNLDVQAWLSKTRTTRKKLAQTIIGLVAKGPRAQGVRDQQ